MTEARPREKKRLNLLKGKLSVGGQFHPASIFFVELNFRLSRYSYNASRHYDYGFKSLFVIL